MDAIGKLRNIDLNLLMVFRAIDQERQVTRAARLLGLSQPALSHALGRLRIAFSDQLFVKTPKGMVPTPRAEKLSVTIRELLQKLEIEVFGTAAFAPESLDRTFRVRTTDLVESLLMPGLLGELISSAPNVRVALTALGFGLPQEALETGQCDLAIAGFFGELPAGFYQQKLFSDSFLCAVRKTHPRLGSKRVLSLENYCDERHILIAPGGELKGKIDTQLRSKGKNREVVAGLSGFIVSGWIASQTDFLLTAPSRLIRLLEKRLGLTVFELPFPSPRIEVVQVWHERNQQDPAHRWFRSQVAETLR